MRRILVGTAAAVLALGMATSASAATTTWTRQPVPLPSAGATGILYSVSCVSATECVAVGYFGHSSSGRHLLAERWDGTTWSARELPLPSGGTLGEFQGVSCGSATDCIAVGYYDSIDDSIGLPLAARWNGTRWSVQAIPLPSGESGELAAVSCTSSVRCTAVGETRLASDTSATLAERWNGHTWTAQSTPDPVGSTYASLTGVSCASATSCTAIGATDGTSTGTFAEQWNGASWTVTSTVGPAGASDDALTGISCSAAARCMAVGNYDDGTQDLPMAELWNGSAWSLRPMPAGLNAFVISAVSCPAAASCTVVGITTTKYTAVVEVWNGSTWTTQATAAPARRNALRAVSCTSAGSCTAVGGTPVQVAGFNPLLAEQN
jgi:hypothetical protein